MPDTNQKRALGQYFTHGNPFSLRPFQEWMRQVWSVTDPPVFLEPFAGANHIVRLVREAGWDAPWSCWDIQPPCESAEGFPVTARDTLAAFPEGFVAAITNPPYLAKNSAVRRGLAFPDTPFDDLYKVALERMLANVGFVAAIIPESFLTAGLFHARLQAGVSLTSKMFEDTAHPVCLALFVPESLKQGTDFSIWDGDRFLGYHAALSACLPEPQSRNRWRFNDTTGAIGLRAVDGTAGPSIAFVRGETIDSSEIKHSSRALTRIGGGPPGREDAVIATANELLATYREETHDTLMTAFKGLRRDGRYRRRLDFTQARRLLDAALEGLGGLPSSGSA